MLYKVDMSASLKCMGEILHEWCEREDLPHMSADELILRPELTAIQECFLMHFIQMWDELNK